MSAYGSNIIPKIITGVIGNFNSIVSPLASWHHYCIIKAANFGYSISFVVPWGREVDCLFVLSLCQ